MDPPPPPPQKKKKVFFNISMFSTVSISAQSVLCKRRLIIYKSWLFFKLFISQMIKESISSVSRFCKVTYFSVRQDRWDILLGGIWFECLKLSQIPLYSKWINPSHLEDYRLTSPLFVHSLLVSHVPGTHHPHTLKWICTVILTHPDSYSNSERVCRSIPAFLSGCVVSTGTNMAAPVPFQSLVS